MIFWKAFIKDEDQKDSSADIVNAVEHQLSVLFSSEAPLRVVKSQFVHARKSNLCFGLDNFQTLSGHIDPTSFARQVEYWIKLYEPRLENINVEVFTRDEMNNRINFSIEAQLRSSTGVHDLTFSSNINLTNQKAQIEEQDFV